MKSYPLKIMIVNCKCDIDIVKNLQRSFMRKVYQIRNLALTTIMQD